MLFALKKPLNSFSLRVSLWEGFAESRMMGLFFSFKASGHSVPVPSGFVKAFRSLESASPYFDAQWQCRADPNLKPLLHSVLTRMQGKTTTKTAPL